MYKTYSVKLLRKETIAKDTMAFCFQKPKGFTYTAGQFIEMQAPTSPPYYFSLASAPYEKELIIATRYRDTDFKNALWKLPIGNNIAIKAPLGNFTLHNDQSIPAVFLASGIGVTPFFSMMKQHVFENKKQKLYLFHVNKNVESSPFFYNTLAVSATSPMLIQVVHAAPLVSQLKQLQFFHDKRIIFYLCGSPENVALFKQQLLLSNVEKSQIRVEEFPGYQAKLITESAPQFPA